MGPYLPWVILTLVNVPIFILYGKLLFDDFQGFLDAIYFWIKPDFVSLFDGQLTEDWWAELKLGLFVATCGALVAAEYHFVVAPYILGIAD
ncbi:MAG: hypothetical protein HZB26_03555 [Candidatus Hydrogenedentes bacterium]|nr:hypothetical protein [Candidatus Hydrogenedentota bacterium]